MHDSVLLIVAGVALQFIAIPGRIYIRKRVQESGMKLRAWVVIEDEFWVIERYLDLAKRNRLPYWPLAALACLPIGLLVMMLAVVLRWTQ